MKTFVLKIGIMIVLILVGCSQTRMMVDYDENVNFQKFKTYVLNWADDDNDLPVSPFDKVRIEKAFASELNDRGMQRAEIEGDLLVSLKVEKESKKYATATNMYTSPFDGYYYGPWYGWGYRYSQTRIQEVEYEETLITCSVFDANDEKLAWQCNATTTLEEAPRVREYMIPKFVSYMMRKFPLQKIRPNSGNW